MLTTLNGIVIRERIVGERGKFIDILTEKLGVIEVKVKGGSKIMSSNMASTQLFAYSKFCLDFRKNMYYINCAEPINIFFGLRSDLKKLALASYFSELVLYAVANEERDNNILKLFLNTLHYTANGKRSYKLLKSIFEMRFMTETGLMPDVIACCVCSEYLDRKAYFVLEDGCVFCSNCISDMNRAIEVSFPVIKALRHIILSDYDRLYNFKLSEKSQKELSLITEKYIMIHLERNFKTLDFYKSIV